MNSAVVPPGVKRAAPADRRAYAFWVGEQRAIERQREAAKQPGAPFLTND